MKEKQQFYIQASLRPKLDKAYKLDATFTFTFEEEARYWLGKLKDTKEFDNNLLQLRCMPSAISKDV